MPAVPRVHEEAFAWAAMTGGLVMVPLLVPGSIFDGLDDSSYWGLRAYLVLVPLLAAMRVALGRGSAATRWTLAAFLAAMPQVYIGNGFWTSAPAAWMIAEVGGMVLFTGIAWVGATRRPILLAAGIAAHGLFWDAWHYQQQAFTPDWYAVGCLYVDVAVALYAYSQVPAWESRA